MATFHTTRESYHNAIDSRSHAAIFAATDLFVTKSETGANIVIHAGENSPHADNPVIFVIDPATAETLARTLFNHAEEMNSRGTPEGPTIAVDGQWYWLGYNGGRFPFTPNTNEWGTPTTSSKSDGTLQVWANDIQQYVECEFRPNETPIETQRNAISVTYDHTAAEPWLDPPTVPTPAFDSDFDELTSRVESLESERANLRTRVRNLEELIGRLQ